MHRFLVCCILAALGFAPPARNAESSQVAGQGCTAFCLARTPSVVVGKNFDWELGTGLLVTHPRNLHRNTFYGNITFNQLATDLPLGGINEAGLVVEELSYSPSRCPDIGDRPAINEFELIQYLLDRCATVGEALQTIGTIAVMCRWMGLHYFLADRSGDVAVLEFLGGKTVIHHGDGLAVPVLANDTYENSVRYLRRHVGFGGDRRETDGPESPERFVRAARRCRDYAEERGEADPVSFAFTALDEVRQDDTMWSIVYDVRNLAVHFRIRGYPGTRIVHLDDLDLANGRRRRVMDLTGELAAGDGSSWVDWAPDVEERLQRKVFDTLGIDIDTEADGEEASISGMQPPIPPDLEVTYVQNAGVKITFGGTSVLVDALFDLTVEPGKPPRLHDHLPPDLVGQLENGLGPVGCVDAVFVTHEHDDHFGIRTARRYLESCDAAGVVCPAGMQDASLPRMTEVDAGAGRAYTASAGPVRYTALGLNHSRGNTSVGVLPHLGYLFYMGPWDVLHLGDAAVSEENLEILNGSVTRGRLVLLIPYWFLTDGDGVRWLRERSGAELIIVLHANRGNRGQVESSAAAVAGTLPQVVVPCDHMQRIDLHEFGGDE